MPTASGVKADGIRLADGAMKLPRWQVQHRCMCLSQSSGRGMIFAWYSWEQAWHSVPTTFCSGWGTCPGGSASPGASYGGMQMRHHIAHMDLMQVLIG